VVIERAKGDLSTLDHLLGGLLVVVLFCDERPPQGFAGLLDWRLPGRVSGWLRRGFFSADFGEQLLFTPGPRLSVGRVLFFGGGLFAGFADRRAEAAKQIAAVVSALKERDVVVACEGGNSLIAEALRGSPVESLLLLEPEPRPRPDMPTPTRADR
jgi:hypothetical protein